MRNINASDNDEDYEMLDLRHDNEVSFSVKDTPEETLLDISPDTLTMMDSVLSPRQSNRIRKVNNKYNESELVTLAKEIKEEEIPWTHYGDPTLFIPTPQGLKTVLKLKKNDLIAYEIWVRVICSELKN